MGRFFQKTPTVIQMEALECGAAALSMILGHYGRFVSLEQLRVACAVSRDGSKASNILKAARHYGLVAKGYKRELEDLKELTLPAILFWEFNHFVVLNKVRGDRYYLKDPGVGDRCLSEAEFSRSFTGVVLEFEPGPDFKAGGEKPSLIVNLLAPFRKQYAFVSYTALLCVLLVSSAFAAPALIRAITDDIFIRDLRGHFWPLLLVVSTIMLFRAALVHLQALHHNRFSYQATRQMSASTLWHLLTLPMQFFGQRYAGDLANRIQSGPLIAQLSTKLFSRLMLLGLSALGLAILLVRYSLSIVLAVFALFVLNVVVYLLLIRMKKDREQRFLMERDRVFSNLMSGLSTIESLKASGRESEFFARFGGFWAKAQNVKNSLGPSEALVTALPFLLATLSSAVVWSFGALDYYQATMTIGMIVAARFLSEQLFSSVEGLTQSQAQVEAFSHAFRRINDVMNYEPAPEWTSHLDSSEGELNGSVTLDRVSFAYDRYAPMVVEDISIDIKAQSRVAFVGATGSGKSTIGKLIAGFYVPQNGEVRFDGLARTQIAHASLTKHMAYVEQEIYLFSGTILENLTLFDASMSFDDVVQAAQDAMIHDDIMNVFGGYDAHVAEGGKNLSGGQIQRLEIARALVRKPKVLILDEATSALDPPTEKRIDDNLKKRGCTLILIAHRLSTIRDADEIIVLDQGHIVQRGTHETLMKAPGPYHTLIQKSG